MGASGGRQSREMNEMRPIQEILVEEHIHALQREAASVRQEGRRIANDTPATTVATASRRRLGGWLIAVGRAVAGGSIEPGADSAKPVARAA